MFKTSGRLELGFWLCHFCHFLRKLLYSWYLKYAKELHHSNITLLDSVKLFKCLLFATCERRSFNKLSKRFFIPFMASDILLYSFRWGTQCNMICGHFQLIHARWQLSHHREIFAYARWCLIMSGVQSQYLGWCLRSPAVCQMTA